MYLSAMLYPVIFFYPLHLYVFVLICQYYVVLLERTNKDIIYSIDMYTLIYNSYSHLIYLELMHILCLSILLWKQFHKRVHTPPPHTNLK